MRDVLPPEVLKRRPGALTAVSTDGRVHLYLRETPFGLRNYPQRCPIDVQLGSWELDGVLVIVMLVRFARSDATTFEYWINAGHPAGVRVLQELAPQEFVEIHLVTDVIARTFRMKNPWRAVASDLLRTIRARNAWSEDEFQAAQTRLSRLYPTPSALWWKAQDTSPSPA